MSKVDTIKEKYRIRETSFNHFNEADKTPTKKYLDRMCYYWVNKGASKIYSKTIIEAIKDFEDLIPYLENKDIYSNYYNLFQNLIKEIDNAKSAKFEKEFKREEHIDVIYENDDYLVLFPKTFKGSMKYGAGTRWCTTGKQQETTFEKYRRAGNLIYVINKKMANSKTNKMAIYQKKNEGIETLFDEFYIYNPNDDRAILRWFTNNGWDEDELVKIFSHIKLFIYKRNKFSSLKDKVTSSIKDISDINLIELINNLKVLNNVDLINDTELEKHKKTIDTFVSKITELTKSY
jgi:hypothetical protein